MTQLYDKITHGDRKTIVRKYKKGTKLTVPGPDTIILKANVALKVTQEYDANHQMWIDVIIHTQGMVETNGASPAPVEDEKQAPLPKAEALAPPSLFERIFGGIFR